MSSVGASTPRIHILAGPNGAGKTTFAREFLTHEAACPTFINADLIASGISPFDPERAAVRAGRIMLELIWDHVEARESFGFETTLAGRGYARSIPAWRSRRYAVRLHFLSLASPEIAVQRVAERVRQGGHDIAEDVIRRRFTKGIQNFEGLYRPLVTDWILYDNSGPEPTVLDQGENP